MEQDQTIVKALFDTMAIRVSPADQPFWYTSGTLGPYYINTHFLYGSEAQASQLLALIEQAVQTPLELPGMLAAVILEHYQQQPVFKAVIDQLVDAVSGLDFDVVSGGERRDYFFSIPVAALTGKPHVAILKDGKAYWSDLNFQTVRQLADHDLRGQKFLHIADLVTEASSYTRTWLPTVARLGGSISDTAVVVDRDQGGREILQQAGVELTALAKIDLDLFEQATSAGLLTQAQTDQVNRFMQDPHQYMVRFLSEHPDFLADQIKLGGKAAERAQRCLDQGYGQA
ncbi:MAG: orotate phosphoribosyltransferase [Clostridia bacterium]|nr:orotate phosphoribosyltransferase [Clostridia bacterium]NCC74918.1 orotate phosphoribosyltransferase [Clostridia bacterium]